LVALYDIWPGNRAVYSYNPGARTGRLGEHGTHDFLAVKLTFNHKTVVLQPTSCDNQRKATHRRNACNILYLGLRFCWQRSAQASHHYIMHDEHTAPITAEHHTPITTSDDDYNSQTNNNRVKIYIKNTNNKMLYSHLKQKICHRNIQRSICNISKWHIVRPV